MLRSGYLAAFSSSCFLLRQRGKTVWYDNEMTDCSTQAMEEGVKHSAHFLLFLSGDPEPSLRLDATGEQESEISLTESCRRRLQTPGNICIVVVVALFVAGVTTLSRSGPRRK